MNDRKEHQRNQNSKGYASSPEGSGVGSLVVAMNEQRRGVMVY